MRQHVSGFIVRKILDCTGTDESPPQANILFAPYIAVYVTFSALSEEEMGPIPPFHQVRTANLPARFPFPANRLFRRIFGLAELFQLNSAAKIFFFGSGQFRPTFVFDACVCVCDYSLISLLTRVTRYQHQVIIYVLDTEILTIKPQCLKSLK